MKVVILAGGLGTRISEETSLRPKPMVDIGGRPIIWHIMKIYSAQGFNEFVICLGYKGYVIKEYFANYFLHRSDVTIDTQKNSIIAHSSQAEDWTITLIDTGTHTMTGGRLKRISKYLDNGPFLLTYGDGVSDVDINKSIEHHRKEAKLLTVTAVRPSGRFGALNIGESGLVTSFVEKPEGNQTWINGGFFVCEKNVVDYIDNDATIWERGPMEAIAAKNSMTAYKHGGFWQCMDTVRDRNLLENSWNSGEAPWKIW